MYKPWSVFNKDVDWPNKVHRSFIYKYHAALSSMYCTIKRLWRTIQTVQAHICLHTWVWLPHCLNYVAVQLVGLHYDNWAYYNAMHHTILCISSTIGYDHLVMSFEHVDTELWYHRHVSTYQITAGINNANDVNTIT